MKYKNGHFYIEKVSASKIAKNIALQLMFTHLRKLKVILKNLKRILKKLIR